MKIEKIEVYGFQAAFRGLRNPKNSWDKSDSLHGTDPRQVKTYMFGNQLIYAPEYYVVGPNDLALAKKLIKSGTEHRKFLRHIQVWVDLTLPRYVWTELDTYKVATVRNSCSTMYKLGSRDLVQEDFAYPIPQDLLKVLNLIGKDLRDNKNKKDNKAIKEARIQLKNLLPEGYLQKATYLFNYETGMTIFRQRRRHKLKEWRDDHPDSITAMILSLPYMKEFLDV